MAAGPRCARRPAWLQSDLDERRTAGDELANGSAGCLDVGYFTCNVVAAEHRDRIATGCSEDRPGAEHAQTSIAARGPHERAASVPNRREAVTQDCFLWGLVEQQMGVQVDEAGQEGAGKADEAPCAAEAVDRCHGRDPITRDGDRVLLKHSRAVEYPLRGYDVPLVGRAVSEARW